MRNWRAYLLLLGLVAVPARGAEPLEESLRKIAGRPAYKHARWGWLVQDLKTGQTVSERLPDQHFVPASTTKLYSCSAALIALGPEHRFVTKVVTRSSDHAGDSVGDLILIASGDPTMGGRNKPDGSMAYTNSDHTYAEDTSTTQSLTDTDPLYGLKELAKQVHAKGIRKVKGDVLIDDRLFAPAFASGSGPDRVVPICINDNVIDVVITPGEPGKPASVKMRPETAFATLDNQVITDGESPTISATADRNRRITVRGNIPAKSKPLVRIWLVDDPAAFARALFIETLKTQGIELSNVSSKLPKRDEVAGFQVLGEFQSPPLSELVKVILKVSHNLYASTLPLLIAAKEEKRTLREGMRIEGRLIRGLGVSADSVTFAGGAGGANADSTTARATVTLLRAMSTRPDFNALEAGMPILGVDGTLHDVVDANSPARGKVTAKTGTLTWTDHFNEGTMLRSKALAGTMTTANGRRLAFAAFVNDVPLPKGVGSRREARALGEWCEAVFANAPQD